MRATLALHRLSNFLWQGVCRKTTSWGETINHPLHTSVLNKLYGNLTRNLKWAWESALLFIIKSIPPTPYKGHVWCFQDTIITPFLKPLKYSYNTCFTFNVLKKLIHFISSFKNGTIRPTSFFRFVIVMDATIYLLHSIFSSIFSFA